MNKYMIKKGQESLYSILKNNAYENGEGRCLSFYKYIGNEEHITNLTRGDILEKSLCAGNLFRKSGMNKNDKVIIFATNTSDNVLAMLGVILCGAAFTMLPAPIDDGKLDRFVGILDDLKPRFIVCTESLKIKVEEIIENLRDKNVCVDVLNKLRIIDVNKAEGKEGFVPEEISLDHIIDIQYSSGSTSKPKGVMLSYGDIISQVNLRNNIAISKIYSGWLPIFHVFGFNLMIYSVINKDSESNIMCPDDFVDKPGRWFELISKTRAEVIAAPNSIYESYPEMVPARKLKNLDLSSVKKILTASEAANSETMKKFAYEYRELGLTFEKFYVGYGLSETSGGISETAFKIEEGIEKSTINILNLDPEAYMQGKVRNSGAAIGKTIKSISNGELWKDVVLKIVNPETLKVCEEDEMGEIWVQSPAKAMGYYNNEQATRDTFMAELDGCSGYFLRTGDLGIIYDNELYITGRIKDLIIINGKNIIPTDVIAKIKENISVISLCTMAVFSVQKNNKEEMVVVIEADEGKDMNYQEIIPEINSCLLKYFSLTPYKIRFVKENSIPKTDSGKISFSKAKQVYIEDKFEFVDKINDNHDGEIIEDKSATEEKLTEILIESYSYRVSKKTNLLNMGMNSIDVVKLSNIIEDKFNVEVPVKFIFSNPTIEKISLYIDKSVAGENIIADEKDKCDLYSEAVLPENIIVKEYEEGGLAFKNIFLTGATGFLGAYIIRELIKAGAERIYCHVRCSNEKEGFERIKRNMEYYKLWNDEYSEFIFPVPGHLEQDLLGIEKNQYDFLCENIDVIYHNGAVLNFIYPYETLKNINVKGTISTLEMACTGKMKYYNYISSYSVYMNPSHFGKTALEDDEFKDCKGYPLAYTESKWVCEKIIREARAKGLKASIYRPGDITGSAETGIWKYSDMVSRIIKSILKYKTYPQWDKKMYMTTVDYIAEAVVNISKKEENYNRAYNIINNNYVCIERLADLIKECGYNLKKISYDEFKNHLAQSDMDHPLKPLESLFKNDSESFGEKDESMSIIYDTSNVQKSLKGSGIVCPVINVDIIKKYIENFK